MSDTYTQLYIHCVFAVKFRKAMINDAWEERLKLYMIAIVQNNGHTMIAINNMPDHMHMLIGLNPRQSISDIMRLVKCDSSEWVNKEKLTRSKFQWQEGYGAFSYAGSQVNIVARYIQNQKEHHRKKSFLEEYRKILDDFAVPYKEEYLFQDLKE